MEGLKHKHFTVQDSRVHVLEIDLTKRKMLPVMDDAAFPLNTGHAQTRAVEQGAVACGPGEFNITLYHGFGIQDQPQHALVVDGEIWTSGGPGGGDGFLIGDGWAKVQKNLIQVHLWKADGSVIEVDRVNRGHEGEVVAFTPRGGTNEYPKYRGKWFYSFDTQTGIVDQVTNFPPRVWPRVRVIESTYDLGIQQGELLRWKQNLGAEGVRHIVSGWPLLVKDGVNIVPSYEFEPRPSMGPDAWMIRRNPRTALGASEDGKTAYMVFVEGRLPNQYRPDAEKSRGLRLKTLGEICEKQGMWGAVDMDGGGSAFQWSQDEGLIPGCYNQSNTIAGQRPALFSIAAF
jgi:hypothetical protein